MNPRLSIGLGMSWGVLIGAYLLFLALSMVMTGCDLRNRADKVCYYVGMVVILAVACGALVGVWLWVAN